jgi:hypothetical protein
VNVPHPVSTQSEEKVSMKTQSKMKANGIRAALSGNRTVQSVTVSLLATVLSIGLVFSLLPVFFSKKAAAQGEDKVKISPNALRQLEALMQEKESRTQEQQKIDSQLLYKLKQNRGELRAPGFERLAAGVQETTDGGVLLDL